MLGMPERLHHEGRERRARDAHATVVEPGSHPAVEEQRDQRTAVDAVGVRVHEQDHTAESSRRLAAPGRSAPQSASRPKTQRSRCASKPRT